MENNFEYATRHKIRFNSTRGALTVEMLWDVPLRSRDGFDLDAVAKEANRSLKTMVEESFVQTERPSTYDRAEITLEIIKHVIRVKLAEESAAKKRADHKVEKEKLLRILAEKEDGKLSELSVEELKKRINDLD